MTIPSREVLWCITGNHMSECLWHWYINAKLSLNSKILSYPCYLLIWTLSLEATLVINSCLRVRRIMGRISALKGQVGSVWGLRAQRRKWGCLCSRSCLRDLSTDSNEKESHNRDTHSSTTSCIKEYVRLFWEILLRFRNKRIRRKSSSKIEQFLRKRNTLETE